jgi:hypothetical protein
MCHTIIYLFESLGSLVLRLVPVALNRKSISRLLTAAGREKLLISAADLCKSRICLRSTCLFDLNSHSGCHTPVPPGCDTGPGHHYNAPTS